MLYSITTCAALYQFAMFAAAAAFNQNIRDWNVMSVTNTAGCAR
jgi:hypothetical protein